MKTVVWTEIHPQYFEASCGNAVLGYIYEDAPLFFGKSKGWNCRTHFLVKSDSGSANHKFGKKGLTKEQAMAELETMIATLGDLISGEFYGK